LFGTIFEIFMIVILSNPQHYIIPDVGITWGEPFAIE